PGVYRQSREPDGNQQALCSGSQAGQKSKVRVARWVVAGIADRGRKAEVYAAGGNRPPPTDRAKSFASNARQPFLILHESESFPVFNRRGQWIESNQFACDRARAPDSEETCLE